MTLTIKNITSFFVSLCFVTSVFGQWESLEGPYGGYINDLTTNDSFQFAATPHGLYRSGDEGQTWQHLILEEDRTFACLQIGIFENVLLTDAVSYFGGKVSRHLFRSDDHGDTWVRISRPDADTYFQMGINENAMYISDSFDVWFSVDGGNTWILSPVNSLIDRIHNLGSYAGKVYINAYDTLFLSTSEGPDLKMVLIDDSIGGFRTVKAFEDIILAEGSSGRLYRSPDEGKTWSVGFEGLNSWTAFAKSGNNYYVNTAYSIIKSEDQGLTWTDQHSNNYSGLTHVMTGAGESLLTGSFYTGIIASTDRGKTFVESNLGISACLVSSMAYKDDKLMTASVYKGISSFDTEQKIWYPGLHLHEPSSTITDIAYSGDHILAIAGSKILRSSDQGISWIDVSPFGLHSMPYNFYFFKDDILAGGTPGSYLIISTNDGASWKQYSIQVEGNNVYSTHLFAYNEDTRFVAKRKVLFRSLDYSITWDTAMNGLILENQFAYIHRLYAFGDTIIALEFNDSSYLFTLNMSFDNGDTWDMYNEGIPEHDYFGGIQSIYKYDHILLGCMYNEEDGVYVSFDFGISWQPFNEGLDLGGVNEIIADEEYLYAATSGQGVWRRKIEDLHIVSTSPVSSLGEMIIYPNPSSGNITVKMGSPLHGKANLAIRDIQGRALDSYEIYLNEQMEISTSHLPTGLYLLFIQTGDELHSGKFIIMK